MTDSISVPVLEVFSLLERGESLTLAQIQQRVNSKMHFEVGRGALVACIIGLTTRHDGDQRAEVRGIELEVGPQGGLIGVRRSAPMFKRAYTIFGGGADHTESDGESQPRERPVACSKCGRMTWNISAICGRNHERN